MKLEPEEHIVGAWAEACSGPGWSNQVIWVCIRDGRDGRHRVDCLQPEEQPATIRAHFRLFDAACQSLLSEVRSEVAGNVSTVSRQYKRKRK